MSATPPRDPPELRAGWPVLGAGALLVAAVVAAYHNSFGGPFVFDDLPAIRDNPTIRSLWPPQEMLSPPAATRCATPSP